MSHITTSVEYGIHCLLWMIGSETTPLSTRDLAELQVISPTFLAKIFTKLEKAGIVRASEGVRGGYVLAKAPENISFLEVVEAIDGRKPLFDCQDIRGQCPLFGKDPAPAWVMRGVCAVHAGMLRAEKSMRDALKSQTLGDAAEAYNQVAPDAFNVEVAKWIENRVANRVRRPASKKRSRAAKPGRAVAS